MSKEKWFKGKKLVYIKLRETDNYETKMGDYARKADEKVVSNLVNYKDLFILDIPCGTGRFTKYFEKKGNRIIGADISPSMLRTAQKDVKSPLVRCDAFNLPFKNSVFDCIIAMRVVFHYFQPKSMIEEVKRVVKKDGIIVFDTLNKYSIRYFIYLILKPIRHVGGRSLWFTTKKELENILVSLELKVETVKSQYLLPTRFYRFIPHALIILLDKLESIMPPSLRVITYWKVIKK